MTAENKEKIARMRRSGMSYGQIAVELGISRNTVKTFCRRSGLSKLETSPNAEDKAPLFKACKECGKPVEQTPGRKEKRFCSDRCRNKWWNTHLSEVNREGMREHVCHTCGKTFMAYEKRQRKYCSHDCYIESRFGGASCG